MHVQQLNENNKSYCGRLHVRSGWRLPAVATCIFLWHVTLSHLSPARSSFFDHSSPSPLKANRARSIARIRKHVCIGGFSISRPFHLGEAGSLALYCKNLRLIDHCINNNSTIIVIYRDVLYQAHGYNARSKKRCMQRKMYLHLFI